MAAINSHFKMNETAKIKQHFFDSLKRGTGEAYLIARENPSIDFSKYIIKGALNNYEYDGQSQNSRAQYIFDLISISSKKDKIRRAVLKRLTTENKDTWSLTQLFDLAKLYAKLGDQVAKKTILNRFFNNIIEHSDWVGYQEILELEGLSGLIFIADKIGRFLEQNPGDLQDDNIIRHFQDDNPNIPAMLELVKAAKSNKYIKIYLNNIKRTKKIQAIYKYPLVDFQTLIEQIEKNERTFISPVYTKNLTPTEIKILADNFLKERNLKKKEKYLSIFTRIKYPYDYKPIYKLATRKPTKTNRITEFAVDALKHIKSNEIREFAISKLQNTKSPDTYTNLLISNYVKGDAKLLKSIAERTKNEFIIESLACSYVEIYKANKTKECVVPLIELYKKMNCGIHRNSIIEILIENNILPDNINFEIEFDSNLETRLLHKRNKNG
jgi:hypothetical protein